MQFFSFQLPRALLARELGFHLVVLRATLCEHRRGHHLENIARHCAQVRARSDELRMELLHRYSAVRGAGLFMLRETLLERLKEEGEGRRDAIRTRYAALTLRTVVLLLY